MDENTTGCVPWAAVFMKKLLPHTTLMEIERGLCRLYIGMMKRRGPNRCGCCVLVDGPLFLMKGSLFSVYPSKWDKWHGIVVVRPSHWKTYDELGSHHRRRRRHRLSTIIKESFPLVFPTYLGGCIEKRVFFDNRKEVFAGPLRNICSIKMPTQPAERSSRAGMSFFLNECIEKRNQSPLSKNDKKCQY